MICLQLSLGLFLLMCCYSEYVMAADADPLQDFCVADLDSEGECSNINCLCDYKG